MILTIRNKEFKITFVNNYCRERYQEMTDDIMQIAKIPEDIEKLSSERDAIGDQEVMRRLKEIEADRVRLQKNIVAIRKDILVSLLEKNKYAYDDKWWLHDCDVDDLNEFVLACMRMDVNDERVSIKKK